MALERLMCPLEKLCAQHVPLIGLFGDTFALADKIVKLMDVDFMTGNIMNCKQAATAMQCLLFCFGASIKIPLVMASPVSDEPAEGLWDALGIV